MLATASPQTALSDPPLRPLHQRGRPSISSPITWFNRASILSTVSAKSAPPATPAPLTISAPTIVFDGDGYSPHTRVGSLGSGALRVATPQDALAHARIAQSAVPEEVEPQNLSPESSPVKSSFSPFLTRPVVRRAKSPASRSSSAHGHTRRSSKSSTNSPATSPLALQQEFSPPPVPSIPDHFLPPSPPFTALLVSPLPNRVLDLSQIMVELETDQHTHRTTISTLLSRPSNLSRWIQSLLPIIEPSIDSPTFFRDSVLASSSIPHIFLDRPSAPYAHILAYLRTSPQVPATLPRSVQILSGSPPSISRVEALLELRDEARYLDLEELYRLCLDELASAPPPSSRTNSGSSFGQITEENFVQERRPHRQSKDMPAQPRTSSEIPSSNTVGVHSPRITSKALADVYVPPASTLKARTRSNSRGDATAVRIQGGWL